eukprot:243287-Chlamydomonas_euryale.AAC.13
METFVALGLQISVRVLCCRADGCNRPTVYRPVFGPSDCDITPNCMGSAAVVVGAWAITWPVW